MSWTLETAANDLERYVLGGEPPAVDAVAMMVAWARCGMVGRLECEMKSIPKSSYRVCSRCGAFVRKDAATDCIKAIPVRFCPNCGASVVSGDE